MIYTGLGSIACPRPELSASMTPQACFNNWKSLKRFALSKQQPFDGAVTNITAEADWDTAIGAADPAKLMLTPEINNATVTPGEAVTEQLNDRETLLTDMDDTTVEFTFLGLTPANQTALRLLNGMRNGYVAFVNNAGDVIHQDNGNADIADGESFFKFKQIMVLGRSNNGKGENDKVVVRITFEDGALDTWAKTDLSAFILTK